MRFPIEKRQLYPPLREDSKVVTADRKEQVRCTSFAETIRQPSLALCPWVLERPEKWTLIATIVYASH